MSNQSIEKKDKQATKVWQPKYLSIPKRNYDKNKLIIMAKLTNNSDLA